MRIVLVFILFILSLVMTPQHSDAQGINMEETLLYLNKKFGSVCQIDVYRGVIIASYYEGQDKFREDQVLCKLLDLSTMTYDKTNKIFYVNCNGSSKCVDRQLFTRRIQRDYARISFPVTLDPKSETGVKNAFRHMVNLVLDSKYESSEPFE